MERDFQPAVYLIASKRNGALYPGVTSNLMQCIAQHRAGAFEETNPDWHDLAPGFGFEPLR